MKSFLLKINRTIKANSLLKDGDRVIIGFSGGPDSTCLLYTLLALKKKYRLKLIVVHLNYGARTNASKDENFCKKICHQEKLKFYSYQVNKNVLRFFPANPKKKKSNRSSIFKLPHHLTTITNFENRAREIRYHLFDKLAQENNCSKIAIAHNANDQAETVLINFLRGSGLRGIGGMHHQRGKIIRPLLDISRKEILLFLKKKQLNFRTDETNADLTFTRNKIRHQLIRNIEKKYNPNIIQTLQRNSALYREAETLINQLSEQKLQECFSKKTNRQIVLNWKKMKPEPFIVTATALRTVIFSLRGNLGNISQDVIKKMVHYLNNPHKKKEFSEISKLTIKKNGDKVIFERV
ncbi:MAG: tRNA lysidine(34) synthetase TilS [Patescibacteria group bacterium]|nr:tRNA lysidine(34) synthetase TilS [Patescibacteria group bacterium]